MRRKGVENCKSGEGNELDEESRILNCRQHFIYLVKAVVACVALILRRLGTGVPSE